MRKTAPQGQPGFPLGTSPAPADLHLAETTPPPAAPGDPLPHPLRGGLSRVPLWWDQVPSGEGDVICNETMRQVVDFFWDETHHRPSEEMLAALKEIPATVSRIARGEAAEAFYLCGLDTGIGKSVTLSRAVRNVRKRHPELGVVMCVGRYEQVVAMVKDMGLVTGEYAWLLSGAGDVFCREEGLRNSSIDAAPILLTTHSMVETRLGPKGKARRQGAMVGPLGDGHIDTDLHPTESGRKPGGQAEGVVSKTFDSGDTRRSDLGTWEAASEFYFRGHPRQLRVWDESIAPARELTVSESRLSHLNGVIRPGARFHRVTRELLSRLIWSNDHDTLEVPDFRATITLEEVWDALTRKDREAVAETVDALWGMSGRVVRVRHDGLPGNTALTYERVLPDDIKPMLVLDANLRVKSTHLDRRASKGDVVVLDTARKLYDHVNIYVDSAGGGKSALKRDYPDIVDKVVRLIDRFPDRNILVLHHKEEDHKRGLGDLARDIELNVSRNRPGDLCFCSWGRHNATNKFVHCDLVVVASILYLPPSVIEARARAARELDASHPVDKRELDRTEFGELMGNLLQALTRGAIRQLDGDQARAQDIYMLLGSADQSPGQMARRAISKIFPEATLWASWEGKSVVKDATTFALPSGQADTITFIKGFRKVHKATVYKGLGVDSSNFGKMAKKDNFKAALSEAGYVLVSPGKNTPAYFIRNEDEWTPEIVDSKDDIKLEEQT